jgi:hypothetical protein
MRSTPNQLREFKNSFIYKDLQDEYSAWLSDIRDQLETQHHSESQLRVLQGNAEAVRKASLMVEVLIESAEEDIDETDKEQLEKELKNEDRRS